MHTNKTILAAVVTALLGGLARLAPAQDPVFDVPALLGTPLNPKTTKTTEKDGIVTEEVMFHSEMDGDQSVDIFALFSYPKGGTHLPAYVWNQGGLSQATPYWTEYGAKRGYAVLCIDFPIPGYRSTGGYPISSTLELGDDPKQAPIYHGAVALLKAVSYLESRTDVVDRTRLGMAGSSWGGFYTTLMVGLDPRLKAGSCLFGCGGLYLGSAWRSGLPKDQAWLDHWRATLDPATRLSQVKTPINWCATTDDNFYWMPALMESHARAGGPKHLALIPNWDHALTPALDEQVFVFLDGYLQGKPLLNAVTPVTVKKDGKQAVARWAFSGSRPVQRAEMYLSYGDAGNWRCRYWTTVPATLADTRCEATLPASPMPYYIVGSITDTNGYRSATSMVRVDPAAYGLLDRNTVPAIDGCSEWGDFEEPQVQYIHLHGYAKPPVSPEAHTGKQAAVISGTFTLPPARFIAGTPQQLTGFLKADKPVDVTVKFDQSADAARYAVEKSFAIGTGWTQISLDLTPVAGVDVSSSLTVTAPKDARVLLDTVVLRATGPAKR
jgi:dienelactone hydrolase